MSDPSGEVRVRRLGHGDAALATECVRAFKGASKSEDALRGFLANPSNYLLLAESGGGGEPAGFLTAYRLERADRVASQMFVYEVGVGEAWRRRGVAAALLREIQEIARREGMFEAFVLTSRGNEPARRLYESTGGIVEDDAAILFVYPLAADGEILPPGKREAGE